MKLEDAALKKKQIWRNSLAVKARSKTHLTTCERLNRLVGRARPPPASLANLTEDSGTHPVPALRVQTLCDKNKSGHRSGCAAIWRSLE